METQCRYSGEKEKDNNEGQTWGRRRLRNLGPLRVERSRFVQQSNTNRPHYNNIRGIQRRIHSLSHKHFSVNELRLGRQIEISMRTNCNSPSTPQARPPTTEQPPQASPTSYPTPAVYPTNDTKSSSLHLRRPRPSDVHTCARCPSL